MDFAGKTVGGISSLGEAGKFERLDDDDVPGPSTWGVFQCGGLMILMGVVV